MYTTYMYRQTDTLSFIDIYICAEETYLYKHFRASNVVIQFHNIQQTKRFDSHIAVDTSGVGE